MNRGASVFVAGHQGLVGSAIVRKLQAEEFTNLLLRTRAELDLENQATVDRFFADTRPEYVFLAAAKVGGIHANSTYPADFIMRNLRIQTNVIDAAFRHGTEKLMFLGSSCIYPRLAPQPLREDCLLTGPLEPTNEAYAIAKIAGIQMCAAYRQQHGFDAISLMPTNLYGPGDDFSPEDSHVLPALIGKFHAAKQERLDNVVVWGTGDPRREFLHVDDLADACVFLMERYSDPDLINVGWGEDVTIAELAALIRDVVGYHGRLEFDRDRPDGAPQKLLEISRLRQLGWRPRIPLREGIESTYRWYLQNLSTLQASER